MGERGATSLSEALKSNTTLTELNLGGEDKRKKTHQRHLSTDNSSFLFPSTGSAFGVGEISLNDIGERGATSLSEALKSNTTLKKLNLSCQIKNKAHKRQPSIIHS